MKWYFTGWLVGDSTGNEKNFPNWEKGVDGQNKADTTIAFMLSNSRKLVLIRWKYHAQNKYGFGIPHICFHISRGKSLFPALKLGIVLSIVTISGNTCNIWQASICVTLFSKFEMFCSS